jgi:hypothetical protein
VTGAVRRAETERSARAFSWHDFLPIAAISGGWLGPIVLFWLSAFGPLRAFEDAADPTPHVGWFLAGLAACVLPRWMPAAWFAARDWERGRLYERLGVRWFRQWVPDGDRANRSRRQRDPSHRLIRGQASASAFVERTIGGEVGHLILLVAGVLTTVYAASIGHTAFAIFVTAGNVVLNVYPILLQRYTRARIASVLARRSPSPR